MSARWAAAAGPLALGRRLARGLPAAVLAASLVGLALAASWGGGDSGPPATAAAPPPTTAPDRVRAAAPWRFVSIPDFTNNDVDFPDPVWDPALEPFLTAVAAEEPDFVVVPGDTVMGHWWGGDTARVDELAGRYLAAFRRRMESHGLSAYVAIGDHEIGDNPWTPSRAALVPAFKAAFTRELAMPANGPGQYRGSAYSLRHKNLTLLSVDPYTLRDDRVELGVGGVQIDWLRRRLASRRTVHAVAISSLPVLPAPRKRRSSGLFEPGGAGSPLWSALAEGRAGMYLAGELQDVNVARADGVIQVVAGAEPASVGELNYLVVTVHPDRLELDLKLLPLTVTPGTEYQAGGLKLRPAAVAVAPAGEDGPRSIGRMTIATDGTGPAEVGAASGILAERFTELG